MRTVEAINRASTRIFDVQKVLVNEWLESLTNSQLETLLAEVDGGGTPDPSWEASLDEFLRANFQAALARPVEKARR
jgi:hypothetical protein